MRLINGAPSRRRWSAVERARILEEMLVPGVVVSAVARRRGLGSVDDPGAAAVGDKRFGLAQVNAAHARMFGGEAEEARRLYLAGQGSDIPGQGR